MKIVIGINFISLATSDDETASSRLHGVVEMEVSKEEIEGVQKWWLAVTTKLSAPSGLSARAQHQLLYGAKFCTNLTRTLDDQAGKFSLKLNGKVVIRRALKPKQDYLCICIACRKYLH